MSGESGRRWTRPGLPVLLGSLSALVIVVGLSFLLVEYVAELRRAPVEKDVVETLREQVRADAGVAVELHAVREEQTARVLARKARAERMAWVLLVAGGVFIACGKRWMSQRSQPVPSLDALVAQRFPPPSPGRRKRRKDQPPVSPTADDAIDLSFVDELVQRLGRGRETAIPLLQAIQTHYRYLPDEVLGRVCELTEITPAQIAGTSSFYAQFRRSPVGRHVVRVCHGTACHVAGADQITQELRRHLGIEEGEDTDARRLFTVDQVACVGCCSLAPVMMIEDETAGRLTPAGARRVLDELVEQS